MTIITPTCATCALVSHGYNHHELGMTEADVTRHFDAVRGLLVELESDYDTIGQCALCDDDTMVAAATVTDYAELA